MEMEHESLQRVPSNQREKKFDLAGVAKRVEELRRELRDLRSTTDGLAEGKALRLLSEEIRKQKDELRKLRDEMKKMTDDMELQSAEVKQSMKVAKTPVGHSHPSLEEKVKFLEKEHQRDEETMRQVRAQMEQSKKEREEIAREEPVRKRGEE